MNKDLFVFFEDADIQADAPSNVCADPYQQYFDDMEQRAQALIADGADAEDFVL